MFIVKQKPQTQKLHRSEMFCFDEHSKETEFCGKTQFFTLMDIRKTYQSIRFELRVVALIISMITTIVICISFFVSSEDLENGNTVLIPHRLSQTAKHESCFLCGMTRSFAALSAGNVAQAKRYNKFSPLLYGMFWLASLLGIAISLKSLFGYFIQTARHNALLTEQQIRK